MKTCFKCGITKPLDDFYKHPRMEDGHLNKCKECNKLDVKVNYRRRRPQYQAYYRTRENTPERKAWKAKRQPVDRAKNPERTKAYQALNYALRTGKITRKPCQVCGDSKVEAHHHDYSKPLDVRWLCFKHHREMGHGQTVQA